MIKNISNLGDAAIYCDFGTEVNKQINSEVIKYFNNIRKKNIKGVNNLTPSYNKLIISYDLKVTNFKEVKSEIEKINESETQKITNKNIKIISSFLHTIFDPVGTKYIKSLLISFIALAKVVASSISSHAILLSAP